MITREQILALQVPTRSVLVPELGGEITLRAPTPKSRLALGAYINENQDAYRAYTDDQALPRNEREGVEKVELKDESVLHVLQAIIDPATGEQMFTFDDYDILVERPVSVLNKLFRNLLELQAGIPSVEDQKKSSD